MNNKQSEHIEYSEQKSNKSSATFIESVNAELAKLSCFKDKSLAIAKINAGFSQQVFKISAVEVSVTGKDKDKDRDKHRDKCKENKQANCSTLPNTSIEPEFYIAKRFSDKKTAQLEAFVQGFLADKALSPKIIYCEGQWLVSEFIDKPLLSQLAISEEEKLTIATSALAKFHSAFTLDLLTSKITKLDLVAVLNDLVSGIKRLKVDIAESDQGLITKAISFAKALQDDVDLSCYNANASNSITECTAIKKLQHQLQHSSNLAIVHGDLNYANLLIGQMNNDVGACIIDFESVAIAPLEYDLGMLMAINNVSLPLTTLTVKNYLKSSAKELDINLVEVTRYSFISSIINWLWFLVQASEKFNNSRVESYRAMALQQNKYAKTALSAVNC